MYKLLIVDDENQIREGLRKILKWEDYDIEICGEAREGEEALKIAKTLNPDIILTDIKMPGMDGIQFLQAVKAGNLSSRIIVLSGYDDFTLVRQAMRYGAVDYLLKPAGKRELIQVIEEIIDQQEDAKLFQRDSGKGLETAQNALLNRIITNSISAMEYNEKMEMLELDFGTGPLAVARLEFVDSLSSIGFPASYLQEIFSICQDYIQDRKKGIAFTNTAGNIVFILTAAREEMLRLDLKDDLEGLLEEIKSSVSTEMYLAVSKPVKSYRGLGEAYKEAENALHYKFIFENKRILFMKEISTYFSEKKLTTEVVQQEIEDLIRDGDKQNILSYLEEAFGNDQEVLVNSNYDIFKNMAMEMMIYMFHYIYTQMLANRMEIWKLKERTLQKLSEIRTLKGMKEILIDAFFKACDEFAQNQMSHYSKIVCDVIYHIKNSYSDVDLSLQYLADEFHVNSAYLGRIFKKETGVNFADYLNLYRIDEAKKLLKETNLRGSELCKKIGFSNYNYFYIVFKKVTGQKPSELRNEIN